MITPLRDQLYVELLDEPEPEAGAIAVVRLERPPSARARVLAVGDEVLESGVGAECVISRLQGIVVGDGRLMIAESAVLGHYVHEHKDDSACPDCGATAPFDACPTCIQR